MVTSLYVSHNALENNEQTIRRLKLQGNSSIGFQGNSSIGFQGNSSIGF